MPRWPWRLRVEADREGLHPQPPGHEARTACRVETVGIPVTKPGQGLLCEKHLAIWKVEAKRRAALKAAAAPKAEKSSPKSAGSSAKAAGVTAKKPRVAKNSGGATRRSVPPVQHHPAPVPTPRVPAIPVAQPAMIMLVGPDAAEAE